MKRVTELRVRGGGGVPDPGSRKGGRGGLYRVNIQDMFPGYIYREYIQRIYTVNM